VATSLNNPQPIEANPASSCGIHRRRLYLAIVIATIGFGFSVLAFHDWAWNERTQAGWIKLRRGGVPMRAEFFVHDDTGRGIGGVEIAILNNSGWSRPMQTDEQGRAVLNLAEPDVQKVVAGPITMQRAAAYWLNSPNVQNGVSIDVLIRTQNSLK
jgi:hypothetical protein